MVPKAFLVPMGAGACRPTHLRPCVPSVTPTHHVQVDVRLSGLLTEDMGH